MKLTLIAAACSRWGIGKHLVVGRTTKETLPNLPGRNIYSISTSEGDFRSLDEAVAHFEMSHIDELLIADGGKLYKSSLHLCSEAEISRIEGIYGCYTFMPDLSTHSGWKFVRYEDKTPNLKIEYWKNECIKLT